MKFVRNFPAPGRPKGGALVAQDRQTPPPASSSIGGSACVDLRRRVVVAVGVDVVKLGPADDRLLFLDRDRVPCAMPCSYFWTAACFRRRNRDPRRHRSGGGAGGGPGGILRAVDEPEQVTRVEVPEAGISSATRTASPMATRISARARRTGPGARPGHGTAGPPASTARRAPFTGIGSNRHSSTSRQLRRQPIPRRGPNPHDARQPQAQVPEDPGSSTRSPRARERVADASPSAVPRPSIDHQERRRARQRHPPALCAFDGTRLPRSGRHGVECSHVAASWPDGAGVAASAWSRAPTTAPAGGRARRVPGHGGQERAALEDAHAQLRVRGSADGRRSRLVAQQRDLAEAVAAPRASSTTRPSRTTSADPTSTT